MNKLTTTERANVIRALVEGNSIASIVRMMGIAKTTILRLIGQFGEACQQFHDERVCKLNSARIQMDEVWAFCHAKQKNVRPELQGVKGIGDVWTWTAIDADSKLMVSWHVGGHEAKDAQAIVGDVEWRLNNRIQLTTDGLHFYRSAVAVHFKNDVDFAQIVKIYGTGTNIGSGKYSPPEFAGIKIEKRIGNPDDRHISTSFVERSNLTVRMGVRRYTRLTNGHSKKFANHVAMTTIFMTCYNWCRIHQTLGVTPAMQAGLTTKLWEIEDLLGLIK